MVGFLADKNQNHQNYVNKTIQTKYTEDFAWCDPLFYQDIKTDTINLVYQLVKDYLLSDNFLGKHLIIL